MGYGFRETTGAFSYWQLESSSVIDSLERLRRNPALSIRAARWLFNHENADPEWYLGRSPEIILNETWMCVELGCLLARLHFLKFPEVVPCHLDEIARYAKQYYNTERGKAIPGDYLEAYNKYIGQIQGAA